MSHDITVNILEPSYDVKIIEKTNIVAITSNVIGVHDHDTRYYTKDQTDILLSNKQDINSYIDGGSF